MWTTIIGHQRQIEQLKKVLESGHFPNAYLFSGLSGIGKRFVAGVFVSAMFCKKSPGACGVCIPCSKIKNRSHPDVFFIEPVTERILIEQVRTLQQNLQYHPLEGDKKVALIDDADRMTEAAANSLLKILEEPPQKTHFILISAYPHRLLPTIRSRCRQVVFPPLSEDNVVGYLSGQKGFDQKCGRQIAKISQGSIGAVARLDPEFMEEILGRLKNLLKSANAADIISTAEIWSKDSERTTLIVDLVVSFYRDILCAGGGSRSAVRLEKDIKAVIGARDALGTTANKQLLFEQLLFTLTA